MDDFELIELYVNNLLDEGQRARVEKRIGNSSEFALLVKQEELIIKAVNDAEGQNFVKMVGDVVHKKEGHVSTLFGNRGWIMGIAASFLLIALVSFLFNSQKSSIEIFKENFEPYPMILMSRGEDMALGSLEELANAYNNQNWEKVISLGENIPAIDIQLYVGLAHMALERFEMADSVFTDALSSDPNSEQENLLLYYKSLTFIAQDDDQKAQILLTNLREKLSKTDPLQKRVSQILSHLD